MHGGFLKWGYPILGHPIYSVCVYTYWYVYTCLYCIVVSCFQYVDMSIYVVDMG